MVKRFGPHYSRSTLQLAGDANGVDWGAFANIGVKIIMEVIRHISFGNPWLPLLPARSYSDRWKPAKSVTHFLMQNQADV
jgi:hypothetical protein